MHMKATFHPCTKKTCNQYYSWIINLENCEPFLRGSIRLRCLCCNYFEPKDLFKEEEEKE